MSLYSLSLLQSVSISNTTTYSPVDAPAKTITYFTLSKSFTSGSLVITAGTNTTFTYTLPAVRYGTCVTVYGLTWLAD